MVVLSYYIDIWLLQLEYLCFHILPCTKFSGRFSIALYLVQFYVNVGMLKFIGIMIVPIVDRVASIYNAPIPWFRTIVKTLIVERNDNIIIFFVEGLDAGEPTRG